MTEKILEDVLLNTRDREALNHQNEMSLNGCKTSSSTPDKKRSLSEYQVLMALILKKYLLLLLIGDNASLNEKAERLKVELNEVNMRFNSFLNDVISHQALIKLDASNGSVLITKDYEKSGTYVHRLCFVFIVVFHVGHKTEPQPI